MSLLSRIVAPAPERRAVTHLNSIPSNTDGYGSDSGEWVSERTALRLIPVYRCVEILAGTIAALPWDAYRRRQAFRESVEPQPLLLTQPYMEITDFDWKFQVVSSLLLRGNAFGVKAEFDRLEYPTQVVPVHPDDVNVDKNLRDGLPDYRVAGVSIPRSDMWHVRGFTLPGCVWGLSPIQQAAQGLGISLGAERYGAAYFRDSATPSGALTTDQDLDDDQTQRTMKSWLSTHGGKRLPAILSGGLKWQSISVSPAEAQFLETRKFQRGEIASLYGVPPHMIGDTEKSTSWGTGIEQQGIGFVTYALGPWLTRLESALNPLLPRGQFVKFNVSALLRGDTKSRYEAYTQARMAGWISVNEIRALEDMPPVPNGDSYIQPLNMAPLGTDPTKTKPPASTPTTEPDDDEESDDEA